MARAYSTSRFRFAQVFSCSFHPALAAQANSSPPSGLSGPAVSHYEGPGVWPDHMPIAPTPFIYPTAEQEKNQPVLCRPYPCLVSMQGGVSGSGAGKSP